MSSHIISALKFKPLPHCHLRPQTCLLLLSNSTLDMTLVHLCCQKGARVSSSTVCLLTMVQLPSVSSSSRPSLHRAFSFLSQYSDESSTLLLHSTCSTQINPVHAQQHWNHTTQRDTWSAWHHLSQPFTFICQSLCFPLWLLGSIDLSPGPLFQNKCLRHTINNLSANQTLHSKYSTVFVLPVEGHFNEAFRVKPTVIELPLSKCLCPTDLCTHLSYTIDFAILITTMPIYWQGWR